MKALTTIITTVISTILASLIVAYLLQPAEVELEIQHDSIPLPLNEIAAELQSSEPQLYKAFIEAYKESEGSSLLGPFDTYYPQFNVVLHRYIIHNNTSSVAGNLQVRIKQNLVALMTKGKEVAHYGEAKNELVIEKIYPGDVVNLLVVNKPTYKNTGVDFLFNGDQLSTKVRRYDGDHMLSWWLDFFVQDSILPYLLAPMMVLLSVLFVIVWVIEIIAASDYDFRMKVSNAETIAKTINFLAHLKEKDGDKFRKATASSKYTELNFVLRDGQENSD